MVSISYAHQSARARKARLARRFGANTRFVETGVLGVLAAASLYLLTSHHLGASRLALGADLLLALFVIWQRWDLGDLEAAAAGLNTDSVQLDRVLEPGLLALMSPEIDARNLWLAASHQWQGLFVLQRLGIPPQVVADLLQQSQTPVDAIWQAAVIRARQLQTAEIDGAIVVTATLLDIPGLKPVISHLKLKPEDVLSVAAWQSRLKSAMLAARQKPYYGGLGRDWSSGYTPILDQFAADLSREIELGYRRQLATVHTPAVTAVLDLVAQNQPAVLIGGIGSGRTAIAYSVAEQLLTNKQVGGLAYYRVRALNASALISAGGRIEDVVTQLLVEASQARNTILFLDEANLFLSSGPGTIDLSQILLPVLQQKAIKLILAMTEHDWQALASKNPALAGTLQRVMIAEPKEADTIAILQDEAISMEYSSKTVISQLAISEAVRLSVRYLPEMSLPGKAITVLESATRFAENGVVTPASVQQAITQTTGAKVVAASQPEKRQLLDLEKQIHQRMINQVRAVGVVADALRRSRAGVASTERPVGSFLFLGPTGVGKTELAKALAAVYYGGEQAMIRLDMSEYQQPSDVSRLLATSSQARAGATLLSQVRQNPSTVVLLDEIEKSHPDILNLLLQLLDEGQLTDGDGRQVSFRDTIIIATSNAAADEIRQRIEKGEKLEAFEAKIIDNLVKGHQFKPELLNRFDEIVLFRPLTKPELAQVVQLMLSEVNATLAEQNVRVELTSAAATWLAEHGYDPTLGARPLRRLVQRTVENAVAEALLAGRLSPGQTMALDAADLAAPDAPSAQ